MHTLGSYYPPVVLPYASAMHVAPCASAMALRLRYAMLGTEIVDRVWCYQVLLNPTLPTEEEHEKNLEKVKDGRINCTQHPSGYKLYGIWACLLLISPSLWGGRMEGGKERERDR
eukprot:988626-Rhodomonas_salina.3